MRKNKVFISGNSTFTGTWNVGRIIVLDNASTRLFTFSVRYLGST
ncbi:hypothetical protein [Methylobacter psychrophilus]|nr:hypothetical protein [Methylobacter psychrophilus]